MSAAAISSKGLRKWASAHMITGGYHYHGRSGWLHGGSWARFIGRKEEALAGRMTEGPLSNHCMDDDWHRFNKLK